MTQDAIRRQQADVLFDHQEAVKYLNALTVNAFQTADTIQEFVEWLRVRSGSIIASEDSVVTPNERHKEAMNYDAAIKLIADIKAQRHRVGDLEQRKQLLGLL